MGCVYITRDDCGYPLGDLDDLMATGIFQKMIYNSSASVFK